MRVIARRKIVPSRPVVSPVVRVDDVVRFLRMGISSGWFDQAEDVVEALESLDDWSDEFDKALKGGCHAN